MDAQKNATAQQLPNAHQDNTTTFLIGFGILLIFVVIGVLASAFLCITLKKDPYLWEVVFEPQNINTTDPNTSDREQSQSQSQSQSLDYAPMPTTDNTQL